jgi:hypothetical protein
MNLYAEGQTGFRELWQTKRMETKKAVRSAVPSKIKSFQMWLDKYPESMSGYERESLAAEAMLAAKDGRSAKPKKRKAKEAQSQRSAKPKKRKAKEAQSQRSAKPKKRKATR